MRYVAGFYRTGTTALTQLLTSGPDLWTGEANELAENACFVMANRILAPDAEGSPSKRCAALVTYHESIRKDDEPIPLLLKDPRAMLSLHWWLERDRLCGDRSHVIATVRDPHDVGVSLSKFQERLRIDKAISAVPPLSSYSTFWHQLHITLANYQIVPCYVCYEMLMRDPIRGVAQACRYLRVQPESLDFSVIDTKLWHERGAT